jgi:hypothetical protein
MAVLFDLANPSGNLPVSEEAKRHLDEAVRF